MLVTDSDRNALTVDSFTQANNGSVMINADNTVSYTSNAGFTGSDIFTYTVGDSRDGKQRSAKGDRSTIVV